MKKVEGIFLLSTEARIPELLLQNYELNVSNTRNICFYFTRGKERSAQLAYAVNFFQKTREFLSKQSTPIKATPESFALMVLAEIMTEGFCRSTRSMHGLNSFISQACANVYQSKISEQNRNLAFQALDTSLKYDVMIL